MGSVPDTPVLPLHDLGSIFLGGPTEGGLLLTQVSSAAGRGREAQECLKPTSSLGPDWQWKRSWWPSLSPRIGWVKDPIFSEFIVNCREGLSPLIPICSSRIFFFGGGCFLGVPPLAILHSGPFSEICLQVFDNEEFDCRTPNEWLNMGLEPWSQDRKPVPGKALLPTDDILGHGEQCQPWWEADATLQHSSLP